VIDTILPGYTPIGWTPPVESWGVLEPLKDVFQIVFDTMDKVFEFFYDLTRSVVGFFLPDVYAFENFFISIYRSFVLKFRVNDIVSLVQSISTDFSNGWLNYSNYDPDVTIDYRGNNNIKVLNVSAFKTYVFNSPLMVGLIQFSLIAIVVVGVYKLIDNIFDN